MIDGILKNRLYSHLFFWGFFFAVFALIASLNLESFEKQFFNSLLLLPIQVTAAYLFNYFQIPHLLLKKKYFFFFISLPICLYLFSAIGRYSVVHLSEPLFREDYVQESISEILSDTPYLASVYAPAVSLYAIIMFCVKAIVDRFKEKSRVETLQKEKANNELKFLKAQIQPHFLFNTLNSLYSLCLTKSDLAPEVVLKLSDLLDFILYESSKSNIPIDQEVKLIEKYIELEKLRYNSKLKLDWSSRLDNGNAPVAPLLLLPLVENAFKHGVASPAGLLEISIDIQEKNGELNFAIENTKSKQKTSDSGRSGIGTSNLQRQLTLNYPHAHSLDVKESDTTYRVIMKINLNSRKS